MRISDWSSDVCSSDLVELRQRLQGPVVLQAAAQAGDQGIEARPAAGGGQGAAGVIGDELGPEGPGRLDEGRNVSGSMIPPLCRASGGRAGEFRDAGHAENVAGQRDVLGKGVSIRCDIGGSRFIKKKKVQ